MERMRAISIRQPWVELILRGKKTKEYRSKRTKKFGKVYLYASLTPADYPPAWRGLKCEPGDLPTGRILGTVDIVDCQWDPAEEVYAYMLSNPRRFQRPKVAKNHPMPIFWIPVF